MKKYKKLICYVVLVILVILISIYFYPRKINKAYQGIMYRLGDSKDTEHVKISIDGYLSKGLLKGDKFKGTISIENKMNGQANSLANRKLSNIDLRLGSSHTAVISYYDDSIGEFISYGSIYISRYMEKFTICVFEKNKDDNGKTWTGKEGLMISAPAGNRDQALEISNSLMRKTLTGIVLK